MFARAHLRKDVKRLNTGRRVRRLRLERLEDRSLLAADLSITKTAETSTVNAGEQIVYDIHVHNFGPDTATNTVVTDTLPTGLLYLGNTNAGGCVQVSTTLSCDLGNVPSGGNRDFEIRLSVPADFLVTQDVNVNEVQMVTLSGGIAADTFKLTFLGQTTAAIAQTADGPAVQTALEGLSNINPGDVAVTGPAGGPYTVTFGGALAAQNVPQLTGTGTGTLVVTVATTTQGNDGGDGSFVLSNTATVSSTNAAADPDPSDNTSTENTFVTELADLRITKFTEPFDTVLAGEIIVYTIYVDNLGPSVARNVVIKDTFLSSDSVSIQSCAFSVSQGGGAINQFTCTTGDLVSTQFGTDIGTFGTNFLMPTGRFPDPMDPMNTVDLGRLRGSFRLLVKGDSFGAAGDPKQTSFTVTNTARVFSSTPDPDTSNNLAISPLTVIPAADLKLTKMATAEEQQTAQPGLMFNNAVFGQAFPTAPNYFVSTRVTAGRRIEYALEIVNNGPSPAFNVVVSDLLPPNVRLYQGSLTATKGTGALEVPVACDGGTAGEPLDRIVCGLGKLDPVKNPVDPLARTSARITFQVIVDASTPAGTVLLNDANVTSDTFERDNDDNYAHTENTVLAAADLSVFKTSVGQNVIGFNATLNRQLENDIANQVTAGKVLRYEISVQNNGPSDSQNVTISDLLPSTPLPGPVTFLSADGAVCRPNAATANDTLFCSVGTLAAGDRRTFDIYVLVDPSVPTGTLLTNCANGLAGASNTVPPGAPPLPPTGGPTQTLTWDPLTANNTGCNITTVTAAADLAIQKSISESKVNAGDQTHFTITVENLGPSSATNVTVVDTLPAGVTYQTDTDSCVQGPVGTLMCSLGTLQPGEIRHFDVFVLVDPSLPPNTSLTNTATVSSTTTDFNLTNNTATAKILALRTDTDLTVTKDAPATVDPGAIITYTITVSNVGLIAATNVVVEDFLPKGLQTISFSLSTDQSLAGVIGDPLRPTVINLGTLAPGEQEQIVITAKVGNDQKDQTRLLNDVRVTSAETDTNPADNLFHSTTTVLQSADGNVKATVKGGTLFITGDKFNNKLRIEDAPAADPNAFRITPLGGTKLNGSFDSFQVHGVRFSVLSFGMGDGNDTLLFEGPLTLPKNLLVSLGNGADRLEMTDATVKGTTSIRADGGNDTIAITDSLFSGKLELFLGSGDDHVDLDGSTVNGNTTITGDAGADVISILDSLLAGKLDISTGTGNDTVTIDGTTIKKAASIRNDGNDDLVTVIDSIFSDAVSFLGGKGFDTLDANAVTRNNSFAKTPVIKGFDLFLS